MTKKSYALQRGEKKTLKVEWKRNYKNLTLTLGEKLVGQVPDKRALQQGQTFALPDGATLRVILEKNKLNIARNDLALPGTPDDPGVKLSSSAGGAVAISFLGFLGWLWQSSGTSLLGPSTPASTVVTLGEILVFLVLAFCIQKRQRWAVWAALIIYGLDTVLLVAVAAQGNGLASFGLSGMFIRAAIFYCLYLGFAGIDGLEAEEATLAMQEAKRRKQASSPVGVSPTGLASTPSLATASDPPVVKVSPPLAADTSICEAYQHIRVGKPESARGILTDYMRQNPENAYGWYLMSFLTNVPDQQIGALQRAMRYDPTLTAAKERLVTISG